MKRLWVHDISIFRLRLSSLLTEPQSATGVSFTREREKTDYSQYCKFLKMRFFVSLFSHAQYEIFYKLQYKSINEVDELRNFSVVA